MKTIVNKCPSCGAKVTLEEGSAKGICEYCGTYFIDSGVQENIKKKNRERFEEIEIQNQVSQNAVKIETERLKNRIIEERIEIEREKRQSRIIKRRIGIATLIISLILGLFFSHDTEGVSLMLAGTVSLWILLFIFTDNNKDDNSAEIDEKQIKDDDNICVNTFLVNCEGMMYKELELRLKEAGFININVIPMGDLYFDFHKLNGRVQEYYINDENFEEGLLYPKNSKIEIYYHSK